MRTLLTMRPLLLAAALAVGIGPAFAEETVIRRDGPGPVERDTTVMKERSSDCASKTVHKENAAGDSKTVTSTDC